MIKVKSHIANHRHIYTAIGGGSPSATNDTQIDLVCLACGKIKSIIVGNNVAQIVFRNIEKGRYITFDNNVIYFCGGNT